MNDLCVSVCICVHLCVSVCAVLDGGAESMESVAQERKGVAGMKARAKEGYVCVMCVYVFSALDPVMACRVADDSACTRARIITLSAYA